MRRLIIPSLFFLSLGFASCGSSRDGVIRDDVYYSPKDEAPVNKAEADGDFRTEKYDLKSDNDNSGYQKDNYHQGSYYSDYDDDFSYSYRITRFHGFYNPYYYSSGWNYWYMGYSSWGAYYSSYSMGWGCNPYGWGCDPFFNPYYPYSYYNGYYNGYYQGYLMGQGYPYYQAYYIPRNYTPRTPASSNMPVRRGAPSDSPQPPLRQNSPDTRSNPRYNNPGNNQPQTDPSNKRRDNPRHSGQPDFNNPPNAPAPGTSRPAPSSPRNGGTNRPRR